MTGWAIWALVLSWALTLFAGVAVWLYAYMNRCLRRDIDCLRKANGQMLDAIIEHRLRAREEQLDESS